MEEGGTREGGKAWRLHLLTSLCASTKEIFLPESYEEASKLSSDDLEKGVRSFLVETGEEQVILLCPFEIAGKIICRDMVNLRAVEADYHVTISAPKLEKAKQSKKVNHETFLVIEGTSSAVAKARLHLETVIKELSPLKPVPEFEDGREVVHVFVDNSNIFIGAQTLPDGSKDYRSRVKVEKLAELVEQKRYCATRVVVGSKPPSTNKIWRRWQNSGYLVRLGTREKDGSGKQSEVFVDDALHASMAKVILDPKVEKSKNVVVLLTGDGNKNGSGNSFPLLLEACIRKGFSVEVWCWGQSCSKAFRAMMEKGKIKLFFLDDYRSEICFVSDIQKKEEQICVICLDGVGNIELKPCGHKIVCGKCYAEGQMLEKLARCPICRAVLKH